MREYFTLHRSVFPSYLTIESGKIVDITLFSSFFFKCMLYSVGIWMAFSSTHAE